MGEDRPPRPQGVGPAGPAARRRAEPLGPVEARRLVGLAAALGLSEAPRGDLRVADILAANRAAGTFPTLLNLAAADLAGETQVLSPARPNPLHRHPLAAAFAGTAINPVAFGPRETAPLVLRRFEDVFVQFGGGYLTIFRGDLVDEASTGIVMRPARVARLAHRVETFPRLALCEGPHKTANPVHFVADRLTRVALMQREAGAAEADCAISVDGSAYADFAAAAAFPALRRLTAGTTYRAERLEVLSTSFQPAGHPFWYMDRAIVEAIVPKLLAEVPQRDGPAAIYLARTDSARRPLRNEPALIEALARRGVVAMEMSRLAPAQQLAAARAADTIVAPHGAALTQIIAARSGARVIECLSPSTGTGSYAALSLVSGARYTPVFGTPLDEAGGWEIDIAALLAALDLP